MGPVPNYNEPRYEYYLFCSCFSNLICNVSFLNYKEKPPPPGNLEVKNVQTRYMILTWDKPKYGSYYQIDNYTIERKKEVSDNFTVAKTLPYTHSELMIKDLDPGTEYTIRLSSNSKYGRSDDVLLTENTLPGK